MLIALEVFRLRTPLFKQNQQFKSSLSQKGLLRASVKILCVSVVKLLQKTLTTETQSCEDQFSDRPKSQKLKPRLLFLLVPGSGRSYCRRDLRASLLCRMAERLVLLRTLPRALSCARSPKHNHQWQFPETDSCPFASRPALSPLHSALRATSGRNPGYRAQ